MLLLRQLLLLLLGVRLIEALPQSGSSSSQPSKDTDSGGLNDGQNVGLLGLLGLGGVVNWMRGRGNRKPPSNPTNGLGSNTRNLLAGLEKPLQLREPFFWGQLWDELGEERYGLWLYCFKSGVEQLLAPKGHLANAQVKAYLHGQHEDATTPKFDQIRDACLKDRLAYTPSKETVPSTGVAKDEQGEGPNEFRLLPAIKNEMVNSFKSNFLAPRPAGGSRPLVRMGRGRG